MSDNTYLSPSEIRDLLGSTLDVILKNLRTAAAVPKDVRRPEPREGMEPVEPEEAMQAVVDLRESLAALGDDDLRLVAMSQARLTVDTFLDSIPDDGMISFGDVPGSTADENLSAFLNGLLFRVRARLS